MDGPGPGELLANTGAKPALVHTGGCPPAPRGLLRTLPQGLWTMLTNILRLIHSKIPNVHAFFFNHPISLRSQFGLNISKASSKSAVQGFGVFCSGLWSICPPLSVETPLPF